METGTALSRAMTYVMQRNKDASKQRIDAINMSYGEYSHWSSSGRVGELMADVINNHGVVWMASAGNDGPVQQVMPIVKKYLAFNTYCCYRPCLPWEHLQTLQPTLS